MKSGTPRISFMSSVLRFSQFVFLIVSRQNDAMLGEQTLMRIHLGEGDRINGKHVYEAIVDLLRSRHLAGATVFRGAMSYGSSRVLHADSIEVMALNLPIVIECVDSR